MDMGDLVNDVFFRESLLRLEGVKEPTRPLQERLVVLGLRRPAVPSDANARRRSWVMYFEAAQRCGLLGDPDIRSKLVSTDDAEFHAGLGECIAAWILQDVLGLPVTVRPPGRAGKVLDFDIPLDEEPFRVEVKAPYRERPLPRTGAFQWGDDSDILARTLDEANSQFEKGRRNLLILVPSLSHQVDREHLVKAFIGQVRIAVPLNLGGNDAPPPPYSFFDQNGKLAKFWGEGTRFTRTSAVLSVEPYLCDADGDTRDDHRILVLHNPFSSEPMRPEVFRGLPQLIREDSEMVWTAP